MGELHVKELCELSKTGASKNQEETGEEVLDASLPALSQLVCSNRTFSLCHHLTTTTRILQFFVFSC